MKFIKNLFGKKDRPIENYEDFWNWFSQHQKDFHKVVKVHESIEADFFDHLAPKLDELHKDIYFVSGMAGGNTAELIFSAEGRVKNFFIIEELVAAAPQIDGWLFTAFKPATNIEDMGIGIHGLDFTPQNLNFYSNVHKEYPDEIDITITYDDYTEDNKDHAYNGVHIFMDHLLGEINFAEIIDNLRICAPADATEELVPIEKLDAFLKWRQKEFIEKHEGTRRNTDDDNYSMLEGTMENGNPLLAVINRDLLNWDAKASHPWLMTIEIKYDGSENKGLPNAEDYQLFNEIEDEIIEELKDHDGYLNIGRRTVDDVREIFFACKEFRKSSKVVLRVIKKYEGQFEMNYFYEKDKYWLGMRAFM